MKNYSKNVDNYFKQKADKYDDVETQIYWNLSDRLLWDVFSAYLNTLPKKFHFLDAGGGTGRWSFKILKDFPTSRGTIFDASPSMLKIAKAKSEVNNFQKRVSIVKGDLLKIPRNLENSFDVVFNFHNVLGFVSNPALALKNMVKAAVKGGLLISFVPNLYHLIYFNLTQHNVPQAEKALRRGKGVFTNEMPEISLFTPDSIKQLYVEMNLQVVLLTGFPSVIYPGFQETQIKGSTRNLQDLLSNQKDFDRIYNLEKRLLQEKDIAARGNNIFIVGVK